MAGRIPREVIQDILARVDLVDLIESRLPLKRSGSSFLARCPFHTEKTPSFNVNRDRQFYHCFGCGAHGNAIDFLMEYDRLEFVEAVESLAELVGVKIPAGQAQAPDDPEAAALAGLYAVQEQAAAFYERQLKAHPASVRAVDYLKGRGITGETALRFRLGYAPPEWQNLPSNLPGALLESAGLLIARDGRRYDRFRGRIMFPIRDRRGRVVGFGGRVLDDATPKYLNSPETAVFKKHREVYGLYELLKAEPKPPRIIVVEGYMDVIMLAQQGIPNAVATLGTATSAEHIDLLFRRTNELVFCFDGDRAGRDAAWKALEASLPSLREGRTLKFLALPDGQDPDSLVREEGADRFLQQVEGAKPFSKYFFEELRRRTGTGSIDSLEQSEVLRAGAEPLINQVPSGRFREELEKSLANLVGEVSVKKLADPKRMGDRQGKFRQHLRENPVSLVRTFLALLLQNPSLAVMIDDRTRQLLQNHAKAGDLARKVFALLDEQPGLTAGTILEFFRSSSDEAVVTGLLRFRPDDRAADETADCIQVVFADTLARLEQQMAKERLEQLIEKARSSPLSPAERDEMRTLMVR